MAVNGEKFWARNQHRYKRYVVIPDAVISEVYCMPDETGCMVFSQFCEHVRLLEVTGL